MSCRPFESSNTSKFIIFQEEYRAWNQKFDIRARQIPCAGFSYGMRYMIPSQMRLVTLIMQRCCLYMDQSTHLSLCLGCLGCLLPHFYSCKYWRKISKKRNSMRKALRQFLLGMRFIRKCSLRFSGRCNIPYSIKQPVGNNGQASLFFNELVWWVRI